MEDDNAIEVHAKPLAELLLLYGKQENLHPEELLVLLATIIGLAIKQTSAEADRQLALTTLQGVMTHHATRASGVPVWTKH